MKRTHSAYKYHAKNIETTLTIIHSTSFRNQKLLDVSLFIQTSQ